MAKVNKKQQTKNALVEAFTQTLGVVTSACRMVGINRTTFYKYYNEDKKFRDIVKYSCRSITILYLFV